MVRDTLSEEQHKELDRQICEDRWLANTKAEELPPLDVLLYLNAAMSGGLIDAKYIDITVARKIIEDNADIREMLKSAWENKSFKAIRVLDILQPPTHSLKSSNHENILYETMQVIRTAWDTPYQGSAAELFVKVINQMNIARNHTSYDNYVPIVQSSGTGKSRMVDEAAKTIFTLPFNLRSEMDQSGFPLPDADIRSCLSLPSGISAIALQTRYHVLLSCIFEEVIKRIDSIPDQQTYADFAKAWYCQLQVKDYRTALYSLANKEFTKISSVTTGEDCLLQAKAKAEKALLKLLAIIAKKSGDPKESDEELNKLQPIRLLLYFDESHGLLEQWTSNSGTGMRSAYHVLCKAFSEFSYTNLFVVYLSTNSNLSRFSPQNKYFWSARANTDPIQPLLDLQAPFIELPFDIWKERYIVTEKKIKLSTVSTLDHMVKFGRPLFWTRWESSKNDNKVNNSLLSYATMKIRGQPGINNGQVMEDGQVAAVAIRLLLEFEPRREMAINAESRLVEGHMRIAFSVPKHREYLRSGAPSEPVLAEAAARMMNVEEPVLKVLSRVLDNGLISKGERGELVARLLLTLAHDSAVQSKDIPTFHPYFSKPIKVIDFLEALVGEEHMAKIRETKPDNIPGGVSLEEAFNDAQINFTHFSKGGDDSIVTDEAAWLALARCMAWACANGQRMIDIYIPILLKDKLLERHVVSGIFVQVKNRSRKERVEIDLEKLKFFSEGGDEDSQTRPYIGLIMELGVHDTPLEPNAKRRKKEPSSSKVHVKQPIREGRMKRSSPSKAHVEQPPARQQPSRAANHTPIHNHPRYSISIVGCSPTVYKVIREEDRSMYDRLLATGDLLEEHPRPDCLEAVLRMKPYWTEAAGSFDWAEQLDDGDYEWDEEPDVGVFVNEIEIDDPA